MVERVSSSSLLDCDVYYLALPRQIYGDPNRRTDTDKPDDSHPPDSTVARMAARRDAQAKARAEAAAAIEATPAVAHEDDDTKLEYEDVNTSD